MCAGHSGDCVVNALKKMHNQTVNIRRWHTRRTVWQRCDGTVVSETRTNHQDQNSYLNSAYPHHTLQEHIGGFYKEMPCRWTRDVFYQDAPLLSSRLRNRHIKELHTHSTRTVDVPGQYSACSLHKKKICCHEQTGSTELVWTVKAYRGSSETIEHLVFS